MKRLILLILTTISIAACQQGNSNNNGNQVATTPLEMNCLNGTTHCNNNLYQQYAGFMPYPNMYTYGYNYNYAQMFMQQGLCNCPLGWSPVYNGTMGLGCVQSYAIQPYVNSYFYWTFGASTTGWGYAAPQATINWNQYSNIPNAGNSVGSCARTVTQSCILNQANTCGAGLTCRQILASSNLGICTN